jgi:ABC-type dipeptide/oligopeptide/nickel transport system ATPase component
MRNRKAEDAWRRVSELDNFPLRLKRVKIEDNKRFSEKFEIDFNSGFTAICGRNGVGKSTIFKEIMNCVTNIPRTNISVYIESFNKATKEVTEKDITDYKNKIYYIEPSIECAKILKYLSITSNTEELLEGIDPNGLFLNSKLISEVNQIVGKSYKSILIYEIEGALDENYTFPYIKVITEEGLEYDCLEMGMGEMLCLYITWYINWIEKNSILLIEEIENFISAFSQQSLINYLALTLTSKGVWTAITSHSEHILEKFDLSNIKLISQDGNGKGCCLPVGNMGEYSDALGIRLPKKGTILVEDGFAKYVALYLINQFDYSLLNEMDVIFIQDGESNLLKIANHYKPNRDMVYELVCIFDADMSDKVIAANKNKITVLALPSLNKNNPESELWNTAKVKYKEISDYLRMADSSRMLEAINNFGNLDYHDRFDQISIALNKKKEIYLDAVMTAWLDCSVNKSLAVQFVLSLRNRAETFSDGISLNVDFNTLINQDIFEYYPQLNTSPQKPFQVIFDGTQLKFVDEFCVEVIFN